MWSCYLTCEAVGTAAGEMVDLVHTHSLVQTGGGHTLVHLRLAQRAWDKDTALIGSRIISDTR